LQNHQTTKLFWGEYLYKFTFNNSIGYIFRDKNFSRAREVLDQLQTDYERGNPLIIKKWSREVPLSELSFLDAKTLYKFLSRASNYQLRIEGNSTNIYSNNKEWLHTIKCAINKSNWVGFWEPSEYSINILTPNTIMVDKANGYEFKVTLGPKQSDTHGFANWARGNPNQVRVCPVLMNNLESQGFVSYLYFYARDEKTVQLCSLMLSNIRRVDKLVVQPINDK